MGSCSRWWRPWRWRGAGTEGGERRQSLTSSESGAGGSVRINSGAASSPLLAAAPTPPRGAAAVDVAAAPQEEERASGGSLLGPTESLAPLSGEGLGYTLGGEELLAPSTFSVAPGLTCLVGPSGAGKSVLLGLLSGRKEHGKECGRCRINGRIASATERRAQINYVTQTDVLPGTSTVHELLAFHATVRLPNLSPHTRDRLIDETIDDLALGRKAHARIGDARVRGLSGGERRRVSIAVEVLVLRGRSHEEGVREVVDAPRGVLLLDEPLSGLDSTSARLTLAALSKLARGDEGGGVPASRRPCVLLSVHQPTHRLLSMADELIVMAPGGRLLFAGAHRSAGGACALSAFFDADGKPPSLCELDPTDPVEAMVEAMFAEEGSAAHKLARLLEDAATHEARADAARAAAAAAAEGTSAPRSPRRSSRREPPLLLQLDALAKRHARLALRHPVLVWTNYLATTLVALFGGLVFFGAGSDDGLDTGVQRRLGLLFFLALYFLLTNLLHVQLWMDEKLLYFHESAAGCYGPRGLLLSKALFELLPLRALPALLCSAIIYPRAALRHSGPDGDGVGAVGPPAALAFSLALCLVNCIGHSLFSAIGVASSSVHKGFLGAALLALYNLLLCGLLLNRAALAKMGASLERSASWARALHLETLLADVLPATSFLYPFTELVLVNELGAGVPPNIEIQLPDVMGTPPPPPLPPVSGRLVLGVLGFSTSEDNGCLVWNLPCAVWADLAALATWLVAAQALCYVSLRYCARDPH